MVIYLGADHRGFHHKEVLKEYLKEEGYEDVVDLGNDKLDEKDDYPDFAIKVAEAVAKSPDDYRGIVVCGSGVGVDIVANKFDGIRSAHVELAEQARVSRQDDDTNVLALGADFLNEQQMKEIVKAWLDTNFSGAERHLRRLKKIKEIEKDN